MRKIRTCKPSSNTGLFSRIHFHINILRKAMITPPAQVHALNKRVNCENSLKDNQNNIYSKFIKRLSERGHISAFPRNELKS